MLKIYDELMELKVKIGKRIKDCRLAKEMTQSEVATALKIPQQQYMRYETGRHYPSIENLIQICDYFNVSSDYILGIQEF